MPQSRPIYPEMASRANPVIETHLKNTFGANNCCYPIGWIKNNDTKFYTYERTILRDTNSDIGNRPTSSNGINSYFVNYLLNPRLIIPANPILIPSIHNSYNCSYEYIVNQDEFITVDLNYVWLKDRNWNALELTTFWVNFNDKTTAEGLIRKFNRRPSWNSGVGANAMRKQVEIARDLGCDRYIMGCVNTVDKVSNNLNIHGNALWFDLDENQIDLLENGEVPRNLNFGGFQEFLDIL